MLLCLQGARPSQTGQRPSVKGIPCNIQLPDLRATGRQCLLSDNKENKDPACSQQVLQVKSPCLHGVHSDVTQTRMHVKNACLHSYALNSHAILITKPFHQRT